MKKVMAKIMTIFMFIVSVFVGETVQVSAAEEYTTLDKTNMNITAAAGTKLYPLSVELGEKTYTYYAVDDFNNATIVLDYIKNNDSYPNADLQWDSDVSLVLCETLDMCTTVSIRTFKNDERKLLNGQGLEIPLSVFSKTDHADKIKESFDKVDASTLNGTPLQELQSLYGNVILDGNGDVVGHKTMYLVVSYTSTRPGYEKGVLFWKHPVDPEVVGKYTEVIPFISLSQIGGGVTISSETEGQLHKAKVRSSVPLKTVKYITTTETYNFEEEAHNQKKSVETIFNEIGAKSQNEMTILDVSGIKASSPLDSTRVGREYVCRIDVDVVENTNYYVYAEDELGNVSIYNIKNVGTSNPVNNNQNNNTNDKTNAGDTPVGETILIVLISVFVLSAVLIIIQRIVDYRRRLY